jgi:hypothetical protein
MRWLLWWEERDVEDEKEINTKVRLATQASHATRHFHICFEFDFDFNFIHYYDSTDYSSFLFQIDRFGFNAMAKSGGIKDTQTTKNILLKHF